MTKRLIACLRTTLLVTVISTMFIILYAVPTAAENGSTRLVFLTATELAAKIRSGETTSLEVVQAFLDQIGTYNQALNAIVTLDAQGALERARNSDEALARGGILGSFAWGAGNH